MPSETTASIFGTTDVVEKIDASKTTPHPSAAGLRHDADPERFAVSIMRCRGFAPDCSYHGQCIFADCFSGDALRREIAQARKRLAELEAELVT